jgi:hypothetical protein
LIGGEFLRLLGSTSNVCTTTVSKTLTPHTPLYSEVIGD